MRYSYEFKRTAVELYRQGMWPDTPTGVKEKSFHLKVREWCRMEEKSGSEALKHKNFNTEWTPEKKLELDQLLKIPKILGIKQFLLI